MLGSLLDTNYFQSGRERSKDCLIHPCKEAPYDFYYDRSAAAQKKRKLEHNFFNECAKQIPVHQSIIYFQGYFSYCHYWHYCVHGTCQQTLSQS